MRGRDIRLGLRAGAGLGLLGAILVLVVRGNSVPLGAEVLLAALAGALAAYQLARAPLIDPAAPARAGRGRPTKEQRAARTRAGAAAGAAVGILTGIAYTVSAFLLVSSGSFRDQVATLLRQNQVGTDAGSLDSIVAFVTALAGCLYILVMPAITAGLGVIGASLYDLARPLGAAPPNPSLLPPGAPPDAAH